MDWVQGLGLGFWVWGLELGFRVYGLGFGDLQAITVLTTH